MKKILLLTVFVIAVFTAYAQKNITVCVSDPTGTSTNIRNAPNGKVVTRLADSESYTVDLISVKNGWWRIRPEVVVWGDNEKTIPLKGSTTGYWIHRSVLGFGITGDPEGSLRVAPSATAKAVKIALEDGGLYLEPVALKGQWVQVVSKDKKYRGWIHRGRICFNPLTTCP